MANRLFVVEDGTNHMTLHKFAMFVRLLQNEALMMQFHEWDERGEGMLTARNFAKFLATKAGNMRERKI